MDTGWGEGEQFSAYHTRKTKLKQKNQQAEDKCALITISKNSKEIKTFCFKLVYYGKRENFSRKSTSAQSVGSLIIMIEF